MKPLFPVINEIWYMVPDGTIGGKICYTMIQQYQYVSGVLPEIGDQISITIDGTSYTRTVKNRRFIDNTLALYLDKSV